MASEPAPDQCSDEELIDLLVRYSVASTPESIAFLQESLKHRRGGTYDKHAWPRLIVRALMRRGPVGIRAMLDALPDAPGAIWPKSIIEGLWYGAVGKLPPYRGYLDSILSLPVELDFSFSDAAARAEAHDALHELAARASDDPDAYYHLLSFLDTSSMGYASSEDDDFDRDAERRRSLALLTEGSIQLPSRVIREFDALVQAAEREETYQQFLTAHPVLLDPLAAEIVPKHKLGTEYITDFVLKRFDGRYVVVEIEKPHDRLFTGGDEYSAQLSHALGQVVDFLNWIDENLDYARTNLPGIRHPRGLLIMGRSAELNEHRRAKLDSFGRQRGIEIVTYDELLEQARQLRKNLVSPDAP